MDPQASSAVSSAVQPVTSAVFDLKCLVGDACRAGQPASNVLSCTALVPQSAMRFQLQNTFLCVRFRDCKSMHLHPQTLLSSSYYKASLGFRPLWTNERYHLLLGICLPVHHIVNAIGIQRLV